MFDVKLDVDTDAYRTHVHVAELVQNALSLSPVLGTQMLFRENEENLQIILTLVILTYSVIQSNGHAAAQETCRRDGKRERRQRRKSA